MERPIDRLSVLALAIVLTTLVALPATAWADDEGAMPTAREADAAPPPPPPPPPTGALPAASPAPRDDDPAPAPRGYPAPPPPPDVARAAGVPEDGGVASPADTEGEPSDGPAAEDAQDDLDVDPGVTPREGSVTSLYGPPSGDASFDRVIEAQPRVVRRPLGLPLDGYYRARYRGRFTDDEDDHDLYQYLVLRYGDEYRSRWSAHFHGRLTWDIDGERSGNQFFVFDSITDTYDSRVNGKVYQAYANHRPRFGPVEQIRVGRQDIEAGDYLLMDGARVDFGAFTGCGIDATVFGGVPTHLYESSIDGDWMAGATLRGRFWRGGEIRLDYVHIEDENRVYGAEANDLYTLTVRQRLRNVYLKAMYQHLDDDPRYAAGSVDWDVVRHDLYVRGSYKALLETQNEQVYDLDPYFAILQELRPYWDGLISVSKGIGEHVYLEGGIAVRQLFDSGDEGTFNREWERYYGSVSTYAWPCRGLSLSLTGEIWDSADETYAAGFEVQWEPSDRWRFRLGTDYALYRFDFFANEERQDSRAVYLHARWRPNRTWSFMTRLRVEDDDFDTYVTLHSGLELDF